MAALTNIQVFVELLGELLDDEGAVCDLLPVELNKGQLALL